jgi:hypothetical protein
LIRRVGDLAQQPGRATPAPLVVAVAKVKEASDLADVRALHLYLGVRMIVTQDKLFATLDETNRIYFMVLDRTGVVRFIAPIAPDDDAADAAVEDVLAAAEQAERARANR